MEPNIKRRVTSELSRVIENWFEDWEDVEVGRDFSINLDISEHMAEAAAMAYIIAYEDGEEGV
jgi:hypothetical protein